MELKKGQRYKHNPSHNIEAFYDSQMKFLWEENHSPDIKPDLAIHNDNDSSMTVTVTYGDSRRLNH
jgi:hypothetical protein